MENTLNENEKLILDKLPDYNPYLLFENIFSMAYKPVKKTLIVIYKDMKYVPINVWNGLGLKYIPNDEEVEISQAENKKQYDLNAVYMDFMAYQQVADNEKVKVDFDIPKNSIKDTVVGEETENKKMTFTLSKAHREILFQIARSLAKDNKDMYVNTLNNVRYDKVIQYIVLDYLNNAMLKKPFYENIATIIASEFGTTVASNITDLANMTLDKVVSKEYENNYTLMNLKLMVNLQNAVLSRFFDLVGETVLSQASKDELKYMLSNPLINNVDNYGITSGNSEINEYLDNTLNKVYTINSESVGLYSVNNPVENTVPNEEYSEEEEQADINDTAEDSEENNIESGIETLNVETPNGFKQPVRQSDKYTAETPVDETAFGANGEE